MPFDSFFRRVFTFIGYLLLMSDNRKCHRKINSAMTSRHSLCQCEATAGGAAGAKREKDSFRTCNNASSTGAEATLTSPKGMQAHCAWQDQHGLSSQNAGRKDVSVYVSLCVYVYIESRTSTQQSTLLNHTTHTRRGWRRNRYRDKGQWY